MQQNIDHLVQMKCIFGKTSIESKTRLFRSYFGMIYDKPHTTKRPKTEQK